MAWKANGTHISFSGDLQHNLEKFQTKFKAAALAIADQQGQELEQYMKANRPWTDRTGNAKARLHHTTQADWGAEKIYIILAHGVFYGVYLEFSMEKRFAIIYPTINTQGPRVVNAFNGAMQRLYNGG